MVYEFYEKLIELALPEELPDQLYFLKIIIYILGFIFMIEMLLTPTYIIINFYNKRRLN